MTPRLKPQTKRALIWAAVSTRPQAEEEERFSIPKQIEDGERLCRERGWQIVDTLVVPGHSRSYRSLTELAQNARRQGIDAFDKLIEHIERRDFDVFICRDANRFARKPSLLHYIVECIIEDVGANIYSQYDDFWVDEENADMWATMQGYKVRAEVKSLVKYTREGLIKRAERGLTTTRVPWSHILIRDEKFRPLRLEVNESKRRLFDDLAYLVVEERTPFNAIEMILYKRFGHVADDGLPYGNNAMYKFLHHPITWGITTYGTKRHNRSVVRGTWMLDDKEPPPEGVILNRSACPPIYTGVQAERLRSELIRRKEMVGKRRPHASYAFTGLLVCGTCGYTLNVSGGERSKHLTMRCFSGTRKIQYQPVCDQQNLPVRWEYIHTYLDELLRKLIATQNISELIPESNETEKRLVQVKSEQKQLSETLDNLILLQSQAAPAAQAAYQKRINITAEQLQTVEQRVRELEAQLARSQVDLASARIALGDIALIMDSFWDLPEAAINQYLHRLMGHRRFVTLDGKIVGIAPYERRKVRRKPTK